VAKKCKINKFPTIKANKKGKQKSNEMQMSLEIQCRLPEISIGNEDTPIWKSNTGKYSSSETWNQLRAKFPKVDWYNIVWFPLAIPRHSFILWLAFRDGLTTKYRMSLKGYTRSMVGLFCHEHIETKEHLFFSCSFSRRIWRVNLMDCGVVDPPVFWTDVVN
jgi:hypothetical protein